MKFHHAAVAGLLAILSSTVACTYPPQGGRTDRVLPVEYPQITVLEGLDDSLFVHDQPVLDPGPPMNITVFVRNNVDRHEQHVQYRYMFYDKNRQPCEKDPDWHYKIVPARTRVSLVGSAMDRDAADWNLEIRPAH